MELVLLVLMISAVFADIPPSCEKPIYCNSKLLHHVQMARLYPDSKTFVDLRMESTEDVILTKFEELLNKTNEQPSKEQLQEFVNKYFSSVSELDNWTPTDYNENPAFVANIKDKLLRQYGKDVHSIWPTLGRKIKSEVIDNPEYFSLIPVHHGFIIPGGRFKELYYWDTYWIVEGLLVSGMNDTVKGIILNLIELLRKIGHIPNGARWYYQERSQPPLLTGMMFEYIRATMDIEFLRDNIDALEEELEYWLESQSVAVVINEQEYTLLRYNSPSEGPRPESYYEDFINAQTFNTEEAKTQFYIDIKSGAESGWDFSSRWFKDGSTEGNLTTIHTTEIIPVDLNAIFANALENVAKFHALLHNSRKGAQWAIIAKLWRNSIKAVFWNDEDGIWYDYDLPNAHHRKNFYPSNVAPLWMGAVDQTFIRDKAQNILKYLKESNSLQYPGGVPSSLRRSGEQWDFPNAWPPLVSMVINGIEALGTAEASELAFQVAQTWVRACYQGYVANKQMFEKYDVESPGKVGGGGEYEVQIGFGWSNGVVLELLSKYGHRLSAVDCYNNFD